MAHMLNAHAYEKTPYGVSKRRKKEVTTKLKFSITN